MDRIRMRLALVSAASAAVLAFGTAAMAGTGPEPTDSGPVVVDDPLLVDQRAADDVIQAEFADSSGFSGTKFENDHKTVTLFWAGPVPDGLSELAAQPIHDATVHIQRVPYSYDDFDTEMQSITAQEAGHGLKPTDLTLIGPSADRTYLTIDVVPGTDTKAIDAMTHRLPYKITVGEVPPGGNLVGDRWHDVAPFWGGAAVFSVTGQCSSSFKARRNDNGATEMITARHCGHDQYYNSGSNSGPRVGYAGSGSIVADVIALQGESYAARDYVGSWQSSNNTAVGGHAGPAIGDKICASGAFSGISCQGLVYGDSTHEEYDGVCCGYFATNAVYQAKGLAGEGDSGGPSFAHRADGTLSIRGMIDKYVSQTDAPCRGDTSDGRDCYYAVFFVGQAEIEDYGHLTWVY